MSLETKKINLNPAQMAAVLAVTKFNKKKIYLEWGRGSGKSFVLAFFMAEMVKQMPRASFILVGSTYRQILGRTLPSTKKGLSDLGVVEGIDYVVGKSGVPIGFKKPMYMPDSYANIIHFANGVLFHLVALDGGGDTGRGFNSCGSIGDEAALFDQTKLFENVQTTNRAFEAEFVNCTLYGAEIYASSTPLTKKGKWFVEMEKVCKKHPDTHCFIKASALINTANLRKGWFKEMRDQAPSDMYYNAEILNIRPNAILDGFYPQLNPKKAYYTNYNAKYLDYINSVDAGDFDCRVDGDISQAYPLIISIDWGTFVCCVVSQKLSKTYRVLNSFWCKQPKDEFDLIQDFCDYYRFLKNKRIQLFYGHDGNARVRKVRNDTYGDVIARKLKDNGWIVNDVSKGKPPAPHSKKYLLINMMLRGEVSRFPKIEINEPNNPDLIISLERAEAVEGPNGIQKVKKEERNASAQQQHTTHLSDAFDIPIWYYYSSLLRENYSDLNLSEVIVN